MNTESRELYKKLILGQTADIEPRSRIEAYLLAIFRRGFIGSDYELVTWLADKGIVEPLASDDGVIYTSNNNEIYIY